MAAPLGFIGRGGKSVTPISITKRKASRQLVSGRMQLANGNMQANGNPPHLQAPVPPGFATGGLKCTAVLPESGI